MKKYTYRFNNEETKTVEVDDELYEILTNSDRKFENLERKERSHQVSLDALLEEELNEDENEDKNNPYYDSSAEKTYTIKENNKKIKHLTSILTEKQIERLEKHADGKSLREIGNEEGVDNKTVYESIKSAKKKIRKAYKF